MPVCVGCVLVQMRSKPPSCQYARPRAVLFHVGLVAVDADTSVVFLLDEKIGDAKFKRPRSFSVDQLSTCVDCTFLWMRTDAVMCYVGWVNVGGVCFRLRLPSG